MTQRPLALISITLVAELFEARRNLSRALFTPRDISILELYILYEEKTLFEP